MLGRNIKVDLLEGGVVCVIMCNVSVERVIDLRIRPDYEKLQVTNLLKNQKITLNFPYAILF